MPELPEVETIRMGLQTYLVGHTLTAITVKLPKLFEGKTTDVTGARVTGVRRFGKGLVIDLSNGYCLAVHIKLTGQLIYRSPQTPEQVKVIKNTYSTLPHQWTHIVFSLDNQATLYYNDFRQFGWIKVVKQDELQTLPFFKNLGPEFLKDLSLQQFQEIVQKSKIAIKPLLLEQKKMSGVGNIYANDALFLARIDPRKKANELSAKESEALFHAIATVLHKGLATGGASELSFVNALGQEGSYQKHFLIYGKEGKPCTICGSRIEKIMLGGRGTYLCGTCQKR